MTALIENEQANEYVRSAAIGGMGSLVYTGKRKRDEGMSHFAHLFQTLERNQARTVSNWLTRAPACGRKRPSKNCAVRIMMALWTLAVSRGRTLNNPWRRSARRHTTKASPAGNH
jgi:hypothetical protein